MEEKTKTTVEMTAEEAAEFRAFQEAQARKRAEEKKKADRQTYDELVDAAIEETFPRLQNISDALKMTKKTVRDNFETILEMKRDVLNLTKERQRSHTWTHSNGKIRITIGAHKCDGWKDTVTDGVQMVKDACMDLIKDDTTRALVNQILALMSPDKDGNLKAAKALQLRKLADELHNDRISEGVQIIEEAYIPSLSKTYIYGEVRDDKTGGWKSIPLGMTEA
ncbi:MAG: DUF3164 family protein [Bacteroidales bacterium]|nr:DUF3164 family protein [Bacteroidales bacterium]MBR3097926.1 DUF3164 family protein [Bacteroidales bacterium]MBR6883790.1 DUF3164 family protein [Bacteroidales bacterium]